MRIRFWGTRGSLAKPGSSTLRHGGNTSCVEVRTDDGTLIVLDGGTGLRSLGLALQSEGGPPVQGHLLFSHTHWDHIQGFPFFRPAFRAGNTFEMYAPHAISQSLLDTLRGQMQPPYFPITVDSLDAQLNCHDLGEGTFAVGPARVTTRFLNHPALALGYRFEVDGVVLVYATDHEPHGRDRAIPASPDWRPSHREDERHAEFVAGADLLIHDAQYTAAEYAEKATWGHCTVEYAVDLAAHHGVRQLALYHHDPERSDDELDMVVAACRRRAERSGSGLEVFAAGEGWTLDLGSRPGGAEPPSLWDGGAYFPPDVGIEVAAHRIVVAGEEGQQRAVLAAALASEGYELCLARSSDALGAIRAEPPSLIFLDASGDVSVTLDLCRAIRADGEPRVRRTPVLLSLPPGVAVTERAFAAGATDVLERPYTAAYLRTRARTWLLRATAAQPLTA